MVKVTIGEMPQDDIISFAYALEEAGYFKDRLSVIRYFEKPYRYIREYRCWKKLGFPYEGDKNWGVFVEALLDEKKLEECLKR